jgi:outer membrane protein assembly factor BamB
MSLKKRFASLIGAPSIASIATAVFVSTVLAFPVSGGDWPQFRGPQGDGHVTEGSIPVSWTEEANVKWKADVPGSGHSSPVVGGGLVWLSTAIVGESKPAENQPAAAAADGAKAPESSTAVSLRALAFDQATGRLVYDIELFHPENAEPIHHTNTYASPTPVIDGGRVFFHFGTYGTACVDAATGEVVWRNDGLRIEHQNGPGSSPILWRDRLIIHFDGMDHQYIAALRTDDGQVAWKTDRSGELNPQGEMKKAYCTPTLVESDRGAEVVSPGADWVYGYDPATGEELWKAAYGELGFSTVPKPVAGHGMAYVCTSFNRSRLLAVRFGGQGDVTSSNIVWTSDSQISKKPSILLVGGELFVGNDTGIVTCFDALTGKEIFRERIGGNFSASPIYHNGLIYLFSEEGVTTVIRASRDFEVVATSTLGDGFTASPAVADNALFLRSQSALYRVE